MESVLRSRAALLGAWPLPCSTDESFDDPTDPSTETALCELVTRLGGAIAALRSDAAAARDRLGALHSADGDAAADASFSQINATIDRVEADKTAALEAEQVAADAVLEELQAVAAATAPAALEVLGPAALQALSERLAASRLRLEALPRIPVELSRIELVVDGETEAVGSLLTARIIAPRALRAVDLTLAPLPRFAPLGRPLHLTLVFSRAEESAAHPDDIAGALALAAAYTYVAVRYTSESSVLQPRPCVTITPDIPHLALDVAITFTSDDPDGALTLDGVFIAGVPLPTASSGATLIPMRRCLQPGLLLEEGTSNLQTPCVTESGLAIVPRDGSSEVHVFDSDGAALPGIDLGPLDLGTITIAAGYDDATDTLVLSDCNQLVALRLAAPREAIWRHGDMENCCGLAVLGRRGIVVAGSNSRSTIAAYRLDDGSLLSTTSTRINPVYVAADAITGTIFVSYSVGNVQAFAWDGLDLRDCEHAHSFGSNSSALAVMPPAPGRHRSHLVVCKRLTREVSVYALPELAHVFSGLFGEPPMPRERRVGDAFGFAGIAADPFGTALVVGGNPEVGVGVVPWPLDIPGFPELE